LAHTAAAGDAEVSRSVHSDQALLDDGYYAKLFERDQAADFREAVRWGTMCCAYLLRDHPPAEVSQPRREALARAYTSRGNARAETGDLSGAIEDYGRAIEISEAVRAMREPAGQWPFASRNDLAGAYNNRGMTRRNANDLSGAIKDHGRAIELTEQLQAL